ncbi:MAG: hypothetical protein Q7T66_16475 [Herminiimonas sp.]|uniref:DUF6776 family protein n=1 Tax=Herminiimonas sp. TaxID=1926289 RepID=UPI002717A306|nr:DUF6776 family protein [Herminiimonas sp.]MDO9422257.1 hypothetical protein [Herminiimonas sp.]
MANKPKPVFKSLRRKLFWQRWSVSPARMTIKNHLPWPLRVLLIAVVLGLSGAIAMWTYDLGRSFTGFKPAATVEQLAALQSQVKEVSEERDRFQTTVNAAESQLNIERSLQAQLNRQIKTLESENSKLKDDLSFFESLLPTNTGADGISIRRFKVEMAEPGQLRYRLLLMQGGKQVSDFTGNYQLILTLVQEGKSAMMTFPKSDATDKFKLSFKHYQRVEGVLTLPEGATVKSAQIKVLERGAMRAQQSANL